MDNSTEKQCCCCCPYPTVDLSLIFAVKGDSSGKNYEHHKQSLLLLRKKLKLACAQHGCFHLIINPKSLPQSDGANLSLLSEESVVKELIQSLFEQEFVESIQESNDCFTSERKSTPSVLFQRKAEDSEILSATYRGRSAESGSVKSTTTQGEPKQSWEFFRCSSSSTTATTLNEKDQNSANVKSDIANNSRLQILPTFVKLLHEVVEVLCSKSLLDLPENKFVCAHDSNEHVNSDLLRVFHYDALSTKEEQLSNLGSSSHTDWGCMTVVWQDSKGGLQIYCHEHQCWNDVEVKVHAENKDGNDDSMVRLFIHVGDYLSLAMNTAARKRKETATMDLSSETKLKWSSPTHRVLCPLRIGNNDARCSLVYFDKFANN